MKKPYQTPGTMIVSVEIGHLLKLSGKSNASIKLGTEGSGEVARGRSASDWDDED